MNIEFNLSKNLYEDDTTCVPIYSNGYFNIWIFPNNINPHMNIYHGNNISESDKCARISLTSASYLVSNDYNINNWALTDDEKIRLISLLKSKNIVAFQDIADTIWKMIIFQYNFEYYCKTGIRNYLPIDLVMPDYTKL